MAVDVRVSIWVASPTRWAHLEKVIAMSVVPRVGEFLKLRNRELGDYFPWKVTEITHREGGAIELSTELLDNIDGRWYSFESESELDECFQSYLGEGWTSERGIVRNTRLLGPE